MNWARLVVVYFVAMIVQWWWSTHFALAGLAPQVLLVLTVVVAARQGPIRAMFLGFGWGLFLDVMSAHLFGANALALTLVGYGTGSVRRQIDVAGLGSQCIVVFFMTLAYFLLLGLLGLVFMRSFYWVGWPQFVFDPFYNCAVTVVLAALWQPRLEARLA